MEASVDTLEAKFSKAESDIDFLSRKLDTEFEKGEDGDKCNPADMLRKLSEVKKDYAVIIKEVKELQQAEKDAMEFFKSELLTSCQALSQLQLQMNKSPENPPELQTVEKLLGVDNLSQTTTDETKSTDSSDSPTVEEGAQASPPAATSYDSPPTLDPHERRSQSDDFLEINEDEFVSVTPLVRGRVKLSELNQTYRILWNHFTEDKNSEPLSTKDMFKMGLRVTGQTGEAKLNILKSLKLISKTRTGEVQLL